MNPPDFLVALLAAVEHVHGGDLHEAEVAYELDRGDTAERLTVTIRRYEVEHAEANDET